MNRYMKIIYVIPVYNDEESFLNLFKEIKRTNPDYDNNFLIINDCSPHKFEKLPPKKKITEIILKENQGSQKAITIGLNYIFDKKIDFDYLIVMDSDGEDKPEDIKKLIEETNQKKNDYIIFASRRKRFESSIFKILYFIYKILFKILTGKSLNFGNYSCIPKDKLEDIINVPFLDFHYSAAVTKSKLRYDSIFCDKGIRYCGRSNMSYSGLFLHAMKSLAIFYKKIFLRFILLLIVINFVLLLNSATVIKANLLLITLFLIFFVYLLFLIKFKASQKNFIYISNYYNFIKDIKLI